ncbi:MAG: hypothetical protein M9962_08080 [Oligoflexia bacterium]|nr:hypothetical protein [Oligoflexia bacterium]
MTDIWRKCSSCKKPLGYSETYWACNVSTCNRSRTFLVFCSVSCWDAHLGFSRHRDSWAEEKKSPTKEFWAKVLAGEELYPPRPAKAKEPEVVKNVSSSPRVIIRKKNS